jgi:hypothetical protein
MDVRMNRCTRSRSRLFGGALLASCAWAALIGAGFTAEATAQTPPPATKKAAAKAKPKPADTDGEPAGSETSRDSTAAWRDYDAGVQLLRTAQPEAAAEKFSKLLTGSNLPGPLMAKTLLQRGIAYRQEGKPALAVADLTSAMYLRNGLSDPEKADAAAQRSAAYREAGLSEQGVAAPDQNRSAAPAVAVAAGGTRGITSPSVNVPVAGLVPGLAPGAEAQASGQSSSGGFFSKLFGSSESAAAAPAPAAAPPPQTAAVSAWAPEPVVSAGAKTKLASANTGTEVLPWERPAGSPPAEDNQSAGKAKMATKAAAAAKPGAPAGKLRLQLAAVMSREEAQASAARVKSQFAGDIGSRAATIDEAALGDATMYIVRFGPYASAAEIKALCTRIRAAGTDCLQAP